MAGFAKLGYLAIREIFRRQKINVERFAIGQASSLKKDLEVLKINKNRNSIASLDAVDFYPSITFLIIEKATWFFGNRLDESEKRRLATGLGLIKAAVAK